MLVEFCQSTRILYSLIYYPLFTLFAGINDWRRIYNFAATPIVSMVTLFILFLLPKNNGLSQYKQLDLIKHGIVRSEYI